MSEIRLERVMEELELPIDVCFKLSQARTIEAQRVELMELKALVRMQYTSLRRKYASGQGYIIGGKNLRKIQELTGYVMALSLPDDVSKMNGHSLLRPEKFRPTVLRS